MFSLLDGEVCVQDAAPGPVGAESREEQGPLPVQPQSHETPVSCVALRSH